jgi:hypothetical protein
LAEVRARNEARMVVEEALRVVRETLQAPAMGVYGEEGGWTRIGVGRGSEGLTGAELVEVRERCARAWQVDPTLGRVADLRGHGALGRGLGGPKARDESVQGVLDRCWQDADNQRSVFSRRALLRVNLLWLVDGEVFFSVHTGVLDRGVKVGLVSPTEFGEGGVVASGEDWLRPVAYRREVKDRVFDVRTGEWLEEGEVRHEYWGASGEMWRRGGVDESVAEFWGGLGVVGDGRSMLHVPVNTLGLRGVPEFMRALDWVEAHALSLSAMVTLAQAL